MKDYKPKRCIYKNICFRSKLEARWAVVFDHLGLDFEKHMMLVTSQRGLSMPTIKEYTDNYVRWRDMLHRNAERIQRSSETRKKFIREADTAPLPELLKEAVKCIADLTGDELFAEQVIASLERRSHDTHQT